MSNDQYIIYQDYAEPPSLEVPSCSSWLPEQNQPRKDSWARRFSIAALTAITIAYPGEPIAPPEVVTLDKWYQQLSIPTPPKPSLHASLQQSTVVDPQLLTQPEETYLSKWYSPLSEPVLPAPDVVKAPYLAFVGEPIISPTGDATALLSFAPLEDPPVSKTGVFEHQQSAFVEDFGTPEEQITLDKWHQPFGTPFDKEGMLIVGEHALVYVESLRSFGWIPALSTPVLPKHLTRTYQITIDPELLTQPEATHIQWLVPLSEPVLPKHLTRTGQVTTDPDLLTQPEDVHIQWLVPLSGPVKLSARIIEFPDLAFVEDFGAAPETITIDKWFVPFSEPPLVEKVVEFPQPAFVEDVAAPAETVTLDKWFQPLSEPTQTNIVISSPEVAFVEDFVAEEIVTLDKWFQPLAEPLTRLKRVERNWLAFVEDVEAPDVTWVQSLAVPTLPAPRVVEFQSFAYVDDFVVPPAPSMDTWFRQLEAPPKEKPRAVSFALGLYQGDPSGFTVPTPPTPPSTPGTWTSEPSIGGGWTPESPASSTWTEEDPI